MSSVDSSAAMAPDSQQQQQQQQQQSKIDPVTCIQDSIDSLALSLFEALRGVRDAVAPESLETPGLSTQQQHQQPIVPISAFKDQNDIEELIGTKPTAKDVLLNKLNMNYYPSRAFDLLEPDYESFIMTYLNDEPYAKELVDRFTELDDTKKKDNQTDAAQTVSDTKEDKPAATAKPALGEVGYEFRKEFNTGWYTGKVVEIRSLAENGLDRRCVYSDGDIEDLSIEVLKELAKLDPKNNDNNNKPKPRLSIKLNAAKSKQNAKEDSPPKKKDIKFPLTQEQYTKLLIETEHERDVQTTQHLAKDILAKSAKVDELVSKLPGMNRTKDMQMKRINELIKENHSVTKELEEAYTVANKRREKVRAALEESTSLALGIEEE